MKSDLDRFSYWTVIAKPKGPRWHCRCVCGTEKYVVAATLRNGASTNCGCKKALKSSARFKKHGLSRTPESTAWYDMRSRCTNKNNPAFRYYGGRGIQICDRWLNGENDLAGLECFVRDMGKRPTGRYSLERIDVEDGYRPGNCKWIELRLQARNRGVCKTYRYSGERLTLADIADKYSIPLKRLQSRLEIGWTIKAAIEQPVCPKRIGNKFRR